jgi:hypothetical protein
VHEDVAISLSHGNVLLPEVPDAMVVLLLVFHIDTVWESVVMIHLNPCFATGIRKSSVMTTMPLHRRASVVPTELEDAADSLVASFTAFLITIFGSIFGSIFGFRCLLLAVDVVDSAWITEVVDAPVLWHIRHANLLALEDELRTGQRGLKKAEKLGCPVAVFLIGCSISVDTAALVMANLFVSTNLSRAWEESLTSP